MKESRQVFNQLRDKRLGLLFDTVWRSTNDQSKSFCLQHISVVLIAVMDDMKIILLKGKRIFSISPAMQNCKNNRFWRSAVNKPCSKKQPLCFLVITSANKHRFSQFFHCYIPQEIFCRSVIETSTSPYMCCYTTFRNPTSSPAIAEKPRDALSQLKCCQLLHNCTKNHIWLQGLPFSCGIKISPVGSLD